MSMLTEKQAESFVAAADEKGYCFEQEEIAQTRDTIADFTKRWGQPDESDEYNGIVLNVWLKLQVRKGDRRRDLIVADFGEARAAIFM